MTKIVPFKEKGYASWYGKKYHGNKTSTGEIYDMYSMTGAHKILPLPSYVKVTNLKNKKWVIIRLNDRGPFLKDRIIDLSYAAAHKLDIIEKGSELVEVELINPKEYEETVVDNQNYDENYLQVGAFKDFINSQTLLDKINNLKILDKYEAKNIQINNLFHILIGPIKNSDELNKIKENFTDSIIAEINKVDKSFNASKIEIRPSQKGNYIGLTCNVYVNSKSDLDLIYQHLSSHPDTRFVI